MTATTIPHPWIRPDFPQITITEAADVERVDDILGDVPGPTLDCAYFPHIVDAILLNSSLSTLLTFRGVSRYFRKRIDKILSHLVVGLKTGPRRDSVEDKPAEPPTIECHTKSGYLIWSIPAPRKVDSEEDQAERQQAAKEFRLYAASAVARHAIPVIDIIGKPDGNTGHVSTIFRRAKGNGVTVSRLVDLRAQFRIEFDKNGDGMAGGYPWDGHRIYLNNWRAKPELRGSGVPTEFIFTITGNECPDLVTTLPPPGSAVIYDFSTWKAPTTPARCQRRGCCGGQEEDWYDKEDEEYEDDEEDEDDTDRFHLNPRMTTFIAHICRVLHLGCAVYIFGLQAIDYEWLDPLYARGVPWALAPTGGRIRGQRVPIDIYIHDATYRLASQLVGMDCLDDIENRLHVMPLRYTWQSYFPFYSPAAYDLINWWVQSGFAKVPANSQGRLRAQSDTHIGRVEGVLKAGKVTSVA